MDLVVAPPLAPMLARLTRDLPRDPGFYYEPKWDGFRCLVFRDRHEIDLRSRNQRSLARYFPELVEGVARLRIPRFIIDGEIVVAGRAGFDFPALLARLHPAASRIERLRRETPASFVAFDLIAVGDDDLRDTPFSQRRGRLEDVLGHAAPPILLTPTTADPDVADRWLEQFTGGGVDGVVAKHRDLRYKAGRRAMVKVKHERTAECVVGGFRVLADEPLVGSLLLGLHDEDKRLRHVGVASSFTDASRRELIGALRRFIAPLEGHPWEHGFGLDRSPLGRLAGAAARWGPELAADWIPIRPELVCEVAYDQWEGDRFRHPARFRRWRPDRDAPSCTFTQMAPTAPLELSKILAEG